MKPQFESRYLRERDLIGYSSGMDGRRIPVSRATLWRWVANGTFPKPVSLGPGVTAWTSSSVAAWEAEHKGGH